MQNTIKNAYRSVIEKLQKTSKKCLDNISLKVRC